MVDKWTRKYMLLARTLALDNDTCSSRKIGSIIVKDNVVVSTGYNGSLSKIDHSNSPEWITYVLNTLLEQSEKDLLHKKYGYGPIGNSLCGKCIRRELNLKSGEKRHYCNCECSERNALYNAASSGHSTKDAIIYCYCILPCVNCASAIIQSKLSKVVCLKNSGEDYSPTSRYLLNCANIVIEEVNEKEI